MPTVYWKDIATEHDGVGVSLSYIGEGFSGDYDPSDPNDLPLLRFTVYRADGDEYTDDAESYCTSLPATISEDDGNLIVEAIHREVSSHMDDGMLHRICENLSYLDASDLQRLKTELENEGSN